MADNDSDSLLSSSTSILVLIVDVSPIPWGDRHFQRSAQDKRCKEKGKRSMGPATMEEMLTAVQSFVGAFTSMERQSALLIIGVCDSESAILYPRKDVLQAWLDQPESYAPSVHDIPANLLEGVASLLSRAARKAAVRVKKQKQQQQETDKPPSQPSLEEQPGDQSARRGAIASAVSKALCLLNRIMVATQATGAISALSTHYLQRTEDEGVVAMMGSSDASSKKKKKKKQSAWSPRIFIVQASEDRSRDYNAMMNCAFCASQQNVVIDACFLTAGKASSPFLEQVCDLTGGIYLAPPSPAQVGSALTEVLVAVFLPRLDCRPGMQLPALEKVDFRARCFETAEMVDLAFCCNQCLSIFKQNPATQQQQESNGSTNSNGNNNNTPAVCPTCTAKILSSHDGRA